MTAQPLPPGVVRAAFAPITRPGRCTCDMAADPHWHVVHVDTYDATVTDRTDATDDEFLARVGGLDQLEAAGIAAASAVQRVLELADELDERSEALWLAYKHADPSDNRRANPRTDATSDAYEDAAERIRTAIAGPPPDGGDVR